MAAFNYYPTYQPFGQNYFQNPYSQQVQQNQQPIQTNGIIWVNGDAEADAYPIAPNNAVTLWHRTAPIVYFKQADASGRPSMKIYDLVEHKPVDSPVKTEEIPSNFATKEDIHAVESSIQTLKNELKAIKREIKKKENVDDDE